MDRDRYRRLAVAIGKSGRDHGLAHVIGLRPFFGMDDALRSGNLAESAAEAHDRAAGVKSPFPAVGPADLKIHLADGQRTGGRSRHPARDQSGLGEGPPDQLARRIKNAFDDDIAIGVRRETERAGLAHWLELLLQRNSEDERLCLIPTLVENSDYGGVTTLTR